MKDLLGIFQHVDAAFEAVKGAKDSGVKIQNVYMPVPNHEIVDYIDPKTSPVRFITFSGAFTGFVSGMALAILTSLVWNLIVSGKPVTSIVPFLVVGFELTILFGAIGTLIALLLFAGLPFRKFPDKGYREEFSNDQFGVWISCSEEQEAEVRSLFERAGVDTIEDISDTSERG